MLVYDRYYFIFFSLIYNVKASDNEEQSAEMFVHFAKEINMGVILLVFIPGICIFCWFVTLQAEATEKVKEWIILTKEHSTEAHRCEGTFGNEDWHYLLDMDMAVLGRNPKDYDAYATDIRSEYQHIPLPEYCERRAKVSSIVIPIDKIMYIYVPIFDRFSKVFFKQSTFMRQKSSEICMKFKPGRTWNGKSVLWPKAVSFSFLYIYMY